jgi:hypothetical protein
MSVSLQAFLSCTLCKELVIDVFARSNTVTVGSNPTQGMDVCPRLFCVRVFPV